MDDSDHPELISRLFALLTMKFADGAADSVKGQGHGKEPQVRLFRHCNELNICLVRRNRITFWESRAWKI